jgi:GNAT superfamily N-acetyltransferase
MSGFVWDVGTQVVGNLSLIPFQQQRSKVYMIANVAVHPEFRRRGIARALTRAALEHLHHSGAAFPWLQVREDNPEAIELYQSLGFTEQFRRSTWQTEPGPIPAPLPDPGIRIIALRHNHARQQQQWLRRAYPPVLEWHLPFQIRDLHPGLLGFFRRLFKGVFVRQLAVLQHNRLAGIAAWQSTQGYYNALWLGLPEKVSEKAAVALLLYARRVFGTRQPLMIEFPAGQAQESLSACGFTCHQTLIWMRTNRWA